MLRITREAPSQAAQQPLIDAAARTPHIAHLTMPELARWIAAETICFAHVDGQCVGLAAWQPINRHWVELGPYVVLESARGQGVGSALVQASLAYTRTSRHYAVSQNPAMHYLLAQAGFDATRFSRLPLAIQLHLVRRVISPRLLAYVQHAGGEIRHYVSPPATC